jgi:hypothetical protein
MQIISSFYKFLKKKNVNEFCKLQVMKIVCVFNVFPDVFCVHTPFPSIYIFLQFTPFLLSPFKSLKEGLYSIYIIAWEHVEQCILFHILLVAPENLIKLNNIQLFF